MGPVPAPPAGCVLTVQPPVGQRTLPRPRRYRRRSARPVLLGQPVVRQMQVDPRRLDRQMPGLGLHRLQRHPGLAQPGQTGVPLRHGHAGRRTAGSGRDRRGRCPTLGWPNTGKSSRNYGRWWYPPRSRPRPGRMSRAPLRCGTIWPRWTGGTGSSTRAWERYFATCDAFYPPGDADARLACR